MKEIEIEQIDCNLYSGQYTRRMALDKGVGIIVSFEVQTFATSKAMAREKIFLGLVQLNMQLEDEVEEFDVDF